MSVDMSQFYQVFFEETEGHIATLVHLLDMTNPEQPEDGNLSEMFRTVHSIKGSSSTFGFDALSRVASEMEALLDAVRKGRRAYSPALRDGLQEAVPELHRFLENGRAGQVAEESRVQVILDQLKRVATEAALVPLEGNAPQEALSSGPAAGDTTDGVDGPVGQKDMGAAGHDAGKESLLSISVTQADRLVELAAAFDATQSALVEAAIQVQGASRQALFGIAVQLDERNADLQMLVRAMRCAPAVGLYGRLANWVDAECRELGKQVDFTMPDEGVEIDRALLDALAEPVRSLVGNSLRHGIELPSERLSCGKPAKGAVRLVVARRGQDVVVEIGDDGMGIDRHRVLSWAVRQGLPVHDAMRDEEIFAFLFEPDFSAKASVGGKQEGRRGLHMIRRRVHALGGRMAISSVPGSGTRVTLRFPESRPAVEVLVLDAEGVPYAIPAVSVVDSVPFALGNVRWLSASVGILHLNEAHLHVLYLASFFGFGGAGGDLTRGDLIIIRSAGHRLALVVDALAGTEQVVVRPLRRQANSGGGLSGLAVLEDGRMAMVVEPDALFAVARAAVCGAPQPESKPAAAAKSLPLPKVRRKSGKQGGDGNWEDL